MKMSMTQSDLISARPRTSAAGPDLLLGLLDLRGSLRLRCP
jgi:hypothetical protein